MEEEVDSVDLAIEADSIDDVITELLGDLSVLYLLYNVFGSWSILIFKALVSQGLSLVTLHSCCLSIDFLVPDLRSSCITRFCSILRSKSLALCATIPELMTRGVRATSLKWFAWVK